MRNITILLALFCTTASAVDYDVLAVRSARPAGDVKVKFPEAVHATIHPPSDLIIRWADGSQELLLAGNGAALLDPRTYDGVWVYYAKISNPAMRPDESGAAHGAKIYRINVLTKQIVRITDSIWTPPGSVADWSMGAREFPIPDGKASIAWEVSDLGPCPMPGKMVFTSSRLGHHVAGNTDTSPNMHMFVLDDIPGVTDWDGEQDWNVECITPGLSTALHPVLINTGEVIWASGEGQGLRDGRIWSIWRSLPDGRQWKPLISGLKNEVTWHFHGQKSDGTTFSLAYYLRNNNGFGSLFASPTYVPSATLHEFLSPDETQNPLLRMGYFWNVSQTPPPVYQGAFPTQRRGLYSVTPWATPFDSPNGYLDGNGVWHAMGKVTHPSGAPHNDTLLVYSPGGANDNGWSDRHGPIYQFKVGVLHTAVAETPQDIEILLEHPDYNYSQPIALTSFASIYGNEAPKHPHVPNPTATPFGIVGSSSAHLGQWKPRNRYEGQINNGFFQGFWAGQDIDETGIDKTKIPAGLDVVAHEPNPIVPRGTHKAPVHGWANHVNERVYLLGRYLFNEPDRPAGDTSWSMEIPVDMDFTFRTFDAEGRTITYGQTRHQLRHGEVRLDCGGCHNHSGSEVKWEGTYASLKPPQKHRTTPLTVPEWNKDVKPLFASKGCLDCHGPTSTSPVKLTADAYVDTGARKLALGFRSYVNPGMAYASRISKVLHGDTPHTPAITFTAAERRKVDEWIDFFCLVSNFDEASGLGGFYDNMPPSLYVPQSGTLKIGSYDYYSGLDGVPSVMLNNMPLTLTQVDDHVWDTGRTLQLGDRVIATAKDKAGNVAKVPRFVREESVTPPPPPPPPPALTAVYLGRDWDKLGDIRNTQPDGKLDHHVRVANLPPNWIVMNVHDGPTKWSNQAGNEGQQDEFWLVRLYPNADGTFDLAFSPRNIPVQPTQFDVYFIYPDGSQAHAVTTYIPPPPPPPTEEKVNVRVETKDGKVFKGEIKKEP